MQPFGSLLFLRQPPETVSQTAVVIGSERVLFFSFFFGTSTFKLILTLWGKHLWHSPRRKGFFVCGGELPPPAGCGRLRLPRRHQRWSAHKSAGRHRRTRQTNRGGNNGGHAVRVGYLEAVDRPQWVYTVIRSSSSGAYRWRGAETGAVGD